MILGALVEALTGVVVALVAAVVLVAPLVHAALGTDRFDRRPSFAVAVTVALTAVFVGGLADLLVGWVPVVGRFVSPIAWAYVLRHLGGSDWPPALFVGGVGWLLTVVFAAVVAPT
ncbi:hypothetical protein [Halosimplex pelagicum]|uniref:Uncharacterized protein n=1 Tax=Halosimplex pelagicum TaxID=869886 RepID=A0A7D5T7B4_9EURY|nr:hypothetical protein [Halosimplex pelagicum]QLH84028.1 hypothetical protein HZS54_21350 [Halosimplex pelagicum]